MSELTRSIECIEKGLLRFESVGEPLFPRLSKDLHKVVFAQLSAEDVASVGAVNRFAYMLTRHDEGVWRHRIAALTATTIVKKKAENLSEPPRGLLGYLRVKLMSEQTAVALYDFQGADQDELSFTTGDRLLIINDSDNGWWMMENLRTNQLGYGPCNYVQATQEARPKKDAPATTANNNAEANRDLNPNPNPNFIVTTGVDRDNNNNNNSNDRGANRKKDCIIC